MNIKNSLFIISCMLNMFLIICLLICNKSAIVLSNYKIAYNYKEVADTEFNLYPRLWSCLYNKENNIYNNSFYGQYGEDKLFYENYFKSKLNGIYVELGALDGLIFSNSYFFENYLGWSGILIEGGYDNCMRLINNQNKRPRSQIICSAICKDEYTEFKQEGAVGGVAKDLPKNWHDLDKKISTLVRCSRIRNILHIHKITHIDLFSLDVEGGEFNVLETFDFSIYIHFWTIEFNSDKDYKNKMVRKLLIENGYTPCSLKLGYNNECWEDKDYDRKVKNLLEKENKYRSNFGVKC